MRKLLALCGAVLCFSVAAAAQDRSDSSATYSTVSAAVSSPASPAPAPPRFNPYELYPWQVAVTYEFVRFNVAGDHVDLHGMNTSLVRFANDWFALEGDVGASFGGDSFGHTSKFVWYGGGPRLAYRHHPKLEFWLHALAGGAHFLPQTALGSQNAFAYMAGGGVDYKFAPRLYFRVQGDYLGTRFFNDTQHNMTAKAGFVLNF